MAFDLNPVAVTAAPLLRAIKAGNWNTRSELADAAGRKRSNIARDLAILVNADLIEERPHDACGRPVVLTDDGEAQLAALDRAANPDAAAGGLTALHTDLEPHPLNPRKDFETAEAEEALDELRVSIVKSGLLQPIVVRPQPTPGKWWIVAGERRWRAIGQAISDGDWEEDQPLPITVRDVDDRDHLLLALNENLQRSNMKAIEEGVAFNAAVQDFGLSTEELANRTGKSQRYVQQRIALLKLDPVDQDRMRLNRDHPDYLSFKAARALTQTPRAPERPAPNNPHLALFLAEAGTTSDELHGVWDGPLALEPNLQWPVGWEGWFDYDPASGELTLGRQACDWLTDFGWGHVDDEAHLYAALLKQAGAVARPDGSCVSDVLRAAYPAPAPEGDEPGSPPEASPAEDPADAFGRILSDRAALAFVELVDRVERFPAADPELAALGYTEAADAISQDVIAGALVSKGAIGIRYRGGQRPHARAYLTSTGAKAWLEQIGFYAHRDDVLFEMRVRVFDLDRATEAKAEGHYLTAWLNPSEAQSAEPQPRGDVAQAEPEQPALIEETPEEREARQASERERGAVARDREIAQRLHDDVVAALADARAGRKPFADAFAGNGSTAGLEALVQTAFGALASAEPELAGAAIAHLLVRGGAMGARYALRQQPLPAINEMMMSARVAARRDPNVGSGYEAEPDPVEDFVQAEVEDTEAAVHGADDLPTVTPDRAQPAVPIRKSIDPDFLVCLEDGRKFKSLKRHLRTRYDLSPDEYRAKWGLPADYPMVAPNYAKRRAELARQMGLEPQS